MGEYTEWVKIKKKTDQGLCEMCSSSVCKRNIRHMIEGLRSGEGFAFGLLGYNTTCTVYTVL
jgi:hypothetical protein